MKVVVVGGGIAGLSAAWSLARSGHDVILLEAGERLGGKVRTDHIDGFLVEAGPDCFLTRKPEAMALCRALGLENDLIPISPGRRVYVFGRGRLHPLPAGVQLVPTRFRPILRSGLFSVREKMRITADLLIPPASPTDDESVGALVTRRFGVAVRDRLAAPLIGGIYAADPDRLSVRATFPHLAEAEVWGGVARRLGRRADRELASDGPLFMTLRSGLGALVSSLADACESADLRTSTEAAQIEVSGAGYVVSTRSGERIAADAVVVATPAPVAASLLDRVATDVASRLRSIEYVDTAAVTLGFRAADTELPEGHGFVVARDAGLRLTACTWVSAKWPDRAPPDRRLVRAFVGGAHDPATPNLEQEELVRVVRSDLERALGIDAEPVLVHTSRWPAGMPQYAPGHLERVGSIADALAGHPRVVLAGAGYGGVGLHDCIRQGMAAAAKICAVQAGGAQGR